MKKLCCKIKKISNIAFFNEMVGVVYVGKDIPFENKCLITEKMGSTYIHKVYIIFYLFQELLTVTKIIAAKTEDFKLWTEIFFLLITKEKEKLIFLVTTSIDISTNLTNIVEVHDAENIVLSALKLQKTF